ncbi:MAG: APC family permease, partial [Gammaproteobacteria bacterium]
MPKIFHENTQSSPNNRFIGVFTLAMMTVSAIISLRNLPSTALEGSTCIFFFLVAAVCFLIPVALSCAELASAWPKQGGIYIWIKEAFGPKFGFLALWLEWAESVVWLPTILSFMATTTAYLINSDLVQNKFFILSAMLIFLWTGTIANFKGISVSSAISSLGVIIGSIIPAILLVILGAVYLYSDSGTYLNWSWATGEASLLPSFDLNSLVIFTGILLGFGGMEIPAYHVRSVIKPKKSYPKAMFLATAIILAISILGSLAIASVVPKDQINLTAGPLQAFYVF